MDVPERLLAGGPWPGVTLVRVTLVAALGVLAWLAARRRAPALRGAVVLAALVGLLVVPAVATVAPVWLPLPGIVSPADAGPQPARPVEVARVPPPLPPERPAVSVVVPAEPPGKMPPGLEDPPDPFDDAETPAENAEPVVAAALPPAEATPPTETEEPRRAAVSAASILVAVWLVGALVCLARALAGLAVLYRWAWRARPIPEADWAGCLKSLPAEDARPGVALRESPAVGSPLTLGLFRPVILLPEGWRGWSAEQLRLVLAHELAHVRRRDFLAGLAAELAVCLCWFHPLVRWLAARLRLEQEYAADARAASAAGDPVAYVRCLARLALEQGPGRGSPAPAFWRRRPEILRRIDMLRRNRDGLALRLGRRTAWAVAAVAAAACVAVAGVGPLRATPDTPATADPTPGTKAPAAGADDRGDPLPAGARARLGTTRWRHGADITYLAFAADGKTLVTAGQDNTVRLWDLATGQEVRRFARPLPAPARPPAGATPRDQAALKAELEAAARARVLGGGGGGAFGVALTPDGKTLAVAGVNVVQLYDTTTGNELRKVDGPPTGVVGLLFSPDGKTLAGRGTDGGVTLWDTDSGKVQVRIKAPARPDNAQLAALGFRAGGNAPGMAFTPDGKQLAVATTAYKEQIPHSSVTFWDVSEGTEVRQVKVQEGMVVSGVAVAPGGKVLAYCAGGVVHACRADNGVLLYQTRMPEPAAGLVFSPDGKTLAVRGVSQQVRVCDAENGKELYVLGDAAPARAVTGATVVLAGPLALSPEVRTVAFSPDGQRIATAAGGTIRLWAAATGKELPLAEGHYGPLVAVVLSPDGKTVVTWGTDRTIRRWAAATGKSLGVFPLPPRATAVALSADGRTAALAGADGTIRVHETDGGREVLQLKGNPRGATALAFSPDGKVLAERGADGTVRLYDPATGGELRQMAAQPGNPVPATGAVVVAPPARFPGGSGAGLVFTPDGKLLAAPGPSSVDPRTRTARGTITLFDVATGKAVRKIEPAVPVVSYAFSPDGRVLATENADDSVSLWEVASGKERARLGAPPAPAVPSPPTTTSVVRVAGVLAASAEASGPATLAFAPDGRVLVGRGPDRTVRAWDVDGGKELGRFKGHDGRVDTIAFTRDGKSVASGSADTTVLLWDAAALRKDLPGRQSAELADGAAEGLWADLAGEDAGKARQSVLTLAAAPGQAVPLLGERLKPAAPIDPQQLERWVVDLESDRFAVRQEAIANLVKAGEQAVPRLQQVLASQPTIETRLRVEGLLDKLTGGTLTAEQLRLVRAVEALERMGTPEARAVLRTLAGGAPGALPTREARAALDRLGGR